MNCKQLLTFIDNMERVTLTTAAGNIIIDNKPKYLLCVNDYKKYKALRIVAGIRGDIVVTVAEA